MTDWIESFLASPEGCLLIRLDPDYISAHSSDPRIKAAFPRLKESLSVILGQKPTSKSSRDGQARYLYIKLHRDFLSTETGQMAMINRFREQSFPPCPRSLCNKFTCFPCAISDGEDCGTAKLYCPNCSDFYEYKSQVDGRAFGKAWLHRMLANHPEVLPRKMPEAFEPRVFGFKMFVPQRGGDTPR
jgi:casein kinase II subunit beta